MEEKTKIDWSVRWDELLQLLDRHRNSSAAFDCIATVSGGKDGSYVAHRLRDDLGMNPLCVTIRPTTETEAGRENLRRFIESGYQHIQVSPNSRAMRELDKSGLHIAGSPYFGWLSAIHTSVARVAHIFRIPLIFYGEDGEVEYGGTSATKDVARYDFDYMRRIYHEGLWDAISAHTSLSPTDLFWYTFPSPEEFPSENVFLTHWSYYEPWDPYRNFLVAKEHCGLKETPQSSSGTFTNFAQTDQSLYALHTYLMYLKFGFGRATQDAGIEIRRGAMTRDQGLELVRLFDGIPPWEYLDDYLDYFEMTEEKFMNTLRSHTNTDLFEFVDSVPVPRFTVA